MTANRRLVWALSKPKWMEKNSAKWKEKWIIREPDRNKAMPRKQMKCNNEIKFCLWYFSLCQNKVYCAWQWTAREGKCSSFFFPLVWPSSQREEEDIFPRNVLSSNQRQILEVFKLAPDQSSFQVLPHSLSSTVTALQEAGVGHKGWDGGLAGTCALVDPKSSIHQQQTRRPLCLSTTLVSASTRKILPFQKPRPCHNRGKAIRWKPTCNRSASAGLNPFLSEDTKGPDEFDHYSLQRLLSVKYPGKAALQGAVP